MHDTQKWESLFPRVVNSASSNSVFSEKYSVRYARSTPRVASNEKAKSLLKY